MILRALGLSAIVACFLLYIFTLAPDVLTADNAEFQLIATNLGIAHPPGFPLYTLLAHLATWLPFGSSPAYRINLLSAFTNSLSLLFVYLSIYRLNKSIWGSITAVITLATATTFWAQATTANIRSLTALFAAITIYCLIRYAQEKGKEKPSAWLSYAILSLSFGITHHVSLIFMGSIFGLFVLLIEPRFRKRPKWWIRPFLLTLLSLLPLLYLPWRALAGADRAPARLATWSGFWNHVLARGFSGDFFYFIEPTILWERLKIMSNVMTFQFAPILIAGMVIGLLLLLWHNWKLALLCGGSFLLHTLITATYRAPQTVEYMLPAYIPAAICLGYGLQQPREKQQGRKFAIYRFALILYRLILLLAALQQGWRNYPSYAALQRDQSPRDYAQLLLDHAPPNSTILAHWHWATTLWYLQEVEQQRQDVLTHFVFPTAELYPETWARRVSEELAAGRDVLTTHYDAPFYQNLPPPEPIGNGYLFRQQAVSQLPDGFTPFRLQLADALTLLGYQLAAEPVRAGQEIAFSLAWQPAEDFCALYQCQQWPVALFAHLVSADGRLLAQEDVTIRGSEGIQVTQFRLTPRLGALPGAYQLLVGAYANTPEGLVAIGTARTAVSTLTLTPMEKRPFSQNLVRYPDPDNPRTLVGYDWDNTLANQPPRLYLHWQIEQGYVTEVLDVPEGMVTLWSLVGGQRRPFTLHNQPSHYVPFAEGIVWTGPLLTPDQLLLPGASLTLRQTFHSNQPILRDIGTSVRLVGYEADGFTWAWANLDEAFGVPAMGAIPTLKWIGGSAVHDPHQFTIPTSAKPGQQVGVLLNLYDIFTNRPIAVLDERFTPALAWQRGYIGE